MKAHNELRKQELEHSITFATKNTEGEARTILMAANDRYDNLNKVINYGLLHQEYSIRQRLNRRKKLKSEILSRESTEGDPK